MEIEIKYVSGAFESGSTIVIDIFVKGLSNPVSLVHLFFTSVPKTIFEPNHVGDNLFSQSEIDLGTNIARVRLENKNWN